MPSLFCARRQFILADLNVEGGESVLHRCRRRAASQQKWQVFSSDAPSSGRRGLGGREVGGEGELCARGYRTTCGKKAEKKKKKKKRKLKCRRFLPVPWTWDFDVLCSKSAAALGIKYSLSNSARGNVVRGKQRRRWWQRGGYCGICRPTTKPPQKNQHVAQCEVSLPQWSS